MNNLSVELTKTPKAKPADESKLGFGQIFSDHMVLVKYSKGKGWHDAKITPYQPIELWPAASVLHYSQSIFEGMKAYRAVDGTLRMFRPEENFKRLANSCRRMCIPEMDQQFQMESLVELLKVDQDWIPKSEGTSLYIRPFIIACKNFLGVHPADDYLYMVILSPSGAYYAEGLNPVKIYVEPGYVRAVRGGTGEVKTGANYAQSLKAQEEAEEQGYTQVLWLDGVERKYIEEVGAMNVFFVIDDEIVTPQLTGSILPGITRKSAVELLKHWGYKVSERRLSIDELEEAAKTGRLKEAFGTGTAAVVSPIGQLKYGDDVFTVNDGKIGEISQKLYDNLTGIQYGKVEDPFGWSYIIK